MVAPFSRFYERITSLSDLPKGFIDEETFECWVPAQAIIVKGGKDGADKSGKRWIQGIASTSVRDLQGEVVDQDGLDFSYFLKSGYYNSDHKPGFANKVGQPTECRLTKQGLWTKGFLFKSHKEADSIWELLNSLDSSGSTRRIGFSIQGKVRRRQGTTIKESWIQDIAITPAPVNHTTWCEMAKSLSAQKWDLSKGEVLNCDNDEENEEKAFAVGSGHPAVPESLGRKVKEDRTSKSLTFDEAVDFVMKSQNIQDRDAATSIAKVAFSIFS